MHPLKLAPLFLALTLLVGCADRADIEPGLDLVEIAGQPVQKATSKEQRVWREFTHSEVDASFQYSRVASYEATVLVVLKKDHISDPFGKPVPLDMVLAWGPFADTSLLEKFNIKLHKRYYSWRTEHPSYNGESVYRLAENLANTHFIASSPEVFDEFRKIPEGSVVRFTGYLVNVKNNTSNATFKTSMKRSDSGWGACEVIEVLTFEVIRNTNDGILGN